MVPLITVTEDTQKGNISHSPIVGSRERLNDDGQLVFDNVEVA